MILNDYHLPWDSDFLGFKVAKINVNTFNQLDTINLFEKFKKENYHLIYLFQEFETSALTTELFSLNRKLVDTKVTFKKELNNLKNLEENDQGIKLVQKISPDLISLAYLSGEYSRFKIDENFKRQVFQDMYKKWIEKSVNNEIADYVFGYFEHNKIIGMITLKLHCNIAKIGLFAVSKDHKGKGIGARLIQKAENICLENNISNLLVETQEKNNQACHFYVKNGFTVLKKEQIYHIWI